MTVEGCEFETERLQAAEWHAMASKLASGRSLASIMAALLTEDVTARLPEQWQGSFTEERAAEWIARRDAESTVLLVVSRQAEAIVGVLVLSEGGEPSSLEVRIGYLLAEAEWGKGYATELVRAVVDWCCGQRGIASLVAGVERDNLASRRVLEKSGFLPVPGDTAATEITYRLEIPTGQSAQ